MAFGTLGRRRSEVRESPGRALAGLADRGSEEDADADDRRLDHDRRRADGIRTPRTVDSPQCKLSMTIGMVQLTSSTCMTEVLNTGGDHTTSRPGRSRSTESQLPTLASQGEQYAIDLPTSNSSYGTTNGSLTTQAVSRHECEQRARGDDLRGRDRELRIASVKLSALPIDDERETESECDVVGELREQRQRRDRREPASDQTYVDQADHQPNAASPATGMALGQCSCQQLAAHK